MFTQQYKGSLMLIIRQVALVTADIIAAENFFSHCLGIKVCYRDPELKTFGLENIIFPIGSQFLEIVSPVELNTTAGRFLDKNGDGGYMVILQCDDHKKYKRRVEELGVRIAHEFQIENFCNMQLHPKDTGGSFLEIDQQLGLRGNERDGPWAPSGGTELEHLRTEISIKFVLMLSRAPEVTGKKWSSILERELIERNHAFEIPVDNSAIFFSKDGCIGDDKLMSVGLSVRDKGDVISRAKELGVVCSEDGFYAFGVDWVFC